MTLMSTSGIETVLPGKLSGPAWSLKGKFGVLALLIAVALAVTGGVVYTTTTDSLTGDAQAELQSSAAAQSGQVGTILETIGSQAQWTATADQVQAGGAGTASAYLTDRYEGGMYAEPVQSVHVVDLSSEEVVASSADAEGTGLSEIGVEFVGGSPSFDESTGATSSSFGTDDAVLSRPFGEVEAEMRIAALVPLSDGSDRAVMMILDANALSSRMTAPKGGSTYLVHPEAEEIFLSTKDSHIGGGLEKHSVITGSALASVSEQYGDGAVTATGKTAGDDHHSGDTLATVGPQAAYVDDISHHGNANVGGATVAGGTDLVLVTQVSQSQAFGLRSNVLETLGIGVVVLLVALGLIGVVVARTTSDITDLSDRAAQVSRGEFDVDVDSDRSDEVGQLYDDIDEMRDSLRSRIDEAERLRRESEQLTEHLQQTAGAYGDTMQDCAEGDLTRRIDPDTESEPMQTVAVEFNDTVTELERAVHETQVFADEVATVAEQIDGRSKGVADASGQVADSVDRISTGAARQSDSLESVLAEMQDLSATVEEIASTSNGVAARADEAAKQSEATKATAEAALDGLENVRTSSRGAVEQFESLDDRVDDVASLVDDIGTIAAQTNRLALNANIEASRAENANDDNGFAAVANEIRGLANNSKEAAEEAETILDQLQAEAQGAADTVDRAATEIDEHAEAFSDVVAAIDDFRRLSEETSAGMGEISAATEQQAAAAEEVVSMVENVAAIAQETTAETETVAAAAQQQSAAATDLSNSASRLATTSTDLADTVDEFETRPDGESGAAPADD